MKVIRIYSEDTRLLERIRVELHDDERLVFGPLEGERDAPLAIRELAAVVVDCRFGGSCSVADAIARVRQQADAGVRCIAIVGGLQRHDIEVIGYVGNDAVDVVLADCDVVGSLVRAIVNDASGSAAAAFALAASERYLKDPARSIARLVLGGGGAPSSVKELTVTVNRDRTSLERSFRKASSIAPSAVLDLVKATYAVALLRRTRLTMLAVAHVTHFSRGSVLDDCVKRVFGRASSDLRSADPEMDINDFLRRLVRRFVRGVSGPLTPPSGTPI